MCHRFVSTVRDRFYLHCFIAHDQKRQMVKRRKKGKKKEISKRNWFESWVRAEYSVLIFTVQREKPFDFFFYIPRSALEKMNIRGERASERLLVHFFFSFFFSWFFKYNIDLYKIHKLFLTIQKWIDQKALLNFISTHFLKAHLLFLFIYLFFSFLSTVFNTQCCFIVVRFSPPGQKPDCAQMDPEVQDASQSCQPLCFCFVFFFQNQSGGSPQQSAM